MIVAANDRLFEKTCEAVGAPELADRPALRDQPAPGREPRRS